MFISKYEYDNVGLVWSADQKKTPFNPEQ